jgi:uncharacterized repeat protein (TIGR03803 family)
MNHITRHKSGELALLMLLASSFITVQFAQAQTFSLLYSFTGKSDGATPQAGLVADSAGNLYGTAYRGGDNSLSVCFNQGCGVVFKLDPAGIFTVLHAFTYNPDGAFPQAGLTKVTTGSFLGTTAGGGSHSNGTIFKIDAAGNETVLHRFHIADGQSPQGGLTRDASGNFYGTTTSGGVPNSFCGSGCGVVYKVHNGGALTVLHSFIGGSDGNTPQSGVVVDASGNIYGTTTTGGTGSCTFGGAGCGVVYKIDPSGNETILHTFVETDGASPVGLVLDAAGNLYGTTFTRGQFGFGEVYKIDSGGNFSVLYSFTGGTDGSQPLAALVLDSSNNIYGTTSGGGSTTNCPFGCGVVFRIDPLGHYRVLHRFNFTDGAFPEAPLLLYHGAIYGTTAGGTLPGVVFKIVP